MKSSSSLQDQLLTSDPEIPIVLNPVSQSKNDKWWWDRNEVYSGEWRIWHTPIPIFRFVGSLLLLAAYIYCQWYATGLCVNNLITAVTLALILGLFYGVWAIWWDNAYAVPPTWTYIKLQQFNAGWILIWLSYNIILVVLTFFLIMCVLVVNVTDKDSWKFDCWDDDEIHPTHIHKPKSIL